MDIIKIKQRGKRKDKKMKKRTQMVMERSRVCGEEEPATNHIKQLLHF